MNRNSWTISRNRGLNTLFLSSFLSIAVTLTGCSGGKNENSRVVLKPSKSTVSPTEQNDTPVAPQECDNCVAPVGGVGSIKGKITYDGAPPNLNPLTATKDVEVCGAQAIPNQKLLVGSDGGLINAFVYLEKAPSGAPKTKPPSEPIIFDQEGCVYIPHCLIVQTPRVIKVTSSDPIAHNVHTYATKNNNVNQIVGKDSPLALRYTNSEVIPVSVKCDVHPWMQAYHLPLDHTFAALTDENGNFEIKDLPAGKYQFKIWHEAAVGGFLERSYEITVQGGETPTEMNLNYASAKFNP